MENMIRTVISVLKCLPQFVLLSRDLQIAMLKRAIHGLFAFCGSLAYDRDHQGFRIVFEEDNGELNVFYLDFKNYVMRGLNQIRNTQWGRTEMAEAVLAPYVDKVRWNDERNEMKNNLLVNMNKVCLGLNKQTNKFSNNTKREGLHHSVFLNFPI